VSVNRTLMTENIKNFPSEFLLKQNYPNPFNPSTTIQFALPKPEYVELKVFNLLGKEVTKLISKNMAAGTYNYKFEANDFASGVYYYQITAGKFWNVKKMILLR